MTQSATHLIEHWGLEPHPEGGWYRETWRAQSALGERSAGTSILFLLKTEESSHWHRVDADELWVWQAGDPLELSIAESDSGPIRKITLGAKPEDDQSLQGLVPAGAWQAARPSQSERSGLGYCLVSCVVVPGFEFAGFELAPPDWAPGLGTSA
ncbi:MAG: cupin domain-containing protein [Pseudomonadota bacterium]